jgi:hypothetical protein
VVKILKDTLKVNNKFSQKRIMTFTSFWVATIYAILPLFVPTFEVKEFVFLGFIGAGGWSIYRTQKTNENITNTLGNE